MTTRYAFQEELGENGTPHLQGTVHFRNQVSFTTLAVWNPRIHWERTHNLRASIQYCTDPAKRHGRLWTSGFSVQNEVQLHLLHRQEFYPWQQDLVTSLEAEPHARRITWYVDAEGGSGKTEFARWAIANLEGCVYVSTGSNRDLSHIIVSQNQTPKIVLLNLPRQAEGTFSYAFIESVKDGIICSTKYSGKTILIPKPHVTIFANWPPDRTKLSHDRWVIKALYNNEEIQHNF